MQLALNIAFSAAAPAISHLFLSGAIDGTVSMWDNRTSKQGAPDMTYGQHRIYAVIDHNEARRLIDVARDRTGAVRSSLTRQARRCWHSYLKHAKHLTAAHRAAIPTTILTIR